MNNLQKLITHVRDFLVQQNERSFFITPDGTQKCAYRGEEGQMCAVGCLISDDVYQPYMECQHVGALLANFPDVLTHIVQKFELNEIEQTCLAEVLDAMQVIHDDGDTPNWENRFNELIEVYSL